VRALVVVGDALLDRDLVGTAHRLAPDAPVPVVDAPQDRPRPGGAALAAVLAAADGAAVTLVTALGADQAGAELRRLLGDAGVDVVDLGLTGPTPEKVRVRVGGQSLVRLDYGGGPTGCGPLTGPARVALEAASAVLVSDYGRGITAEPTVRHALAGAAAVRPVVWDPHPRGTEPVPGVRLATPNADEARRATGQEGDGLAAVTAQARALVDRWGAANVVVTRGARGALLVGADGTPLAVPAPSVAVGDPCGAGDRFASSAATRLAAGALPSEAVPEAVATASAFVAAGGAATWPHTRPPVKPSDAADVLATVRARGGTVVATGGCFDLLHAGHVRMLTAARALGDCLVVCLNSDDSVRRLKGADRPLVGELDRAAVLLGLACVDAVTVFDEDTPEAILATLRPDVWAKGGDYAVEDLPEAPLVASWGGQAVILPYLAGRSTTRLLQEAVWRGARP
jgi:rfaE bifunctional protein nucleotidyltransferase chain/domain/rfaE bifunctional protein kinase chain/domain